MVGHKRPPTRRAAVASVLAQTHPDFELLIVNDGSTDGTAGYLDDLAARDARVRVFHHDQPGGAPRARNKAIREARGSWVTGIDDDDEFLPGRLAALSSVAHAYEISGVAFSLRRSACSRSRSTTSLDQ